LSLIVLAAGFEALLALYMNVERIGRYLQAFQEPSTGALDAQFESTLQCLPHPSTFFQSSVAGIQMEIGVMSSSTARSSIASVFRDKQRARSARKTSSTSKRWRVQKCKSLFHSSPHGDNDPIAWSAQFNQ
jgi:hypothetical protein